MSALKIYQNPLMRLKSTINALKKNNLKVEVRLMDDFWEMMENIMKVPYERLTDTKIKNFLFSQKGERVFVAPKLKSPLISEEDECFELYVNDRMYANYLSVNNLADTLDTMEFISNMMAKTKSCVSEVTAYGYSIASSDGFPSGKDSLTYLYASEDERNEKAYEQYKEIWDTDFDFDKGTDANSNKRLTKKRFIRDLTKDGYVCIQGEFMHVNIDAVNETIAFDSFAQTV